MTILGCPSCRVLKIFQKVMGLITRRQSTNSTSPMIFGIMGCLLCRFLVIFHRVFESFMVSLAALAVKPVKLGHPDICPSENGVSDQGSNSTGSRAKVEDGAIDNLYLRASVDKELSLVPESGCGGEDGSSNPSVLQEKNVANADNKKKEGRIAGKGRGLRKMVSINDNLEEFYIDSKMKRAQMEKWPSMEGEKEEIKPLKSILKVGSKQR